MAIVGAQKTEMPCGCVTSIVKRQVPCFDEETGAPVLNADDSFAMREEEEIQERYCAKHSGKLIERQTAVQKALAAGATYEEAVGLLHGFSPLPALEDGSQDHQETEDAPPPNGPSTEDDPA